MTFYTTARTRRTALEELRASTGLFAQTSMEEARALSPTQAIGRDIELERAEGDFPGFVPETPVIPADEARQRVKDAGNFQLEIPDDGIREGALDILIERAYDRRKREDVFNRRPPGFKPAAIGFGASLAGAMMDPVNIGASFIPVVAPARYAAMVGRASGFIGRTGVRAGVGSVEGALGNVLVEPFVYAAARHEQADYGMSDALLNIALGTVLGAGLHTGGGAVYDAVTRGLPWQTARAPRDMPLPRILDETDMDTRRQALRTGVGQGMTGRQIDVEPVVTPVVRAAEETTVVAARPEPIGFVGGEPVSVGGVEGMVINVTQDGVLVKFPDQGRPQRVDPSEIETLANPDDLRSRADGMELSASNADDMRAARQEIAEARRLRQRADEIEAAGRTAELAEPTRIAAINRMQAAVFRDALRGVDRGEAATGNMRTDLIEAGLLNDAGAITPAGRALVDQGPQKLRGEYDPQAVTAAGRDSFAAENQRSADFDAARAAEERLKEMPEDDAMPQESLDAAMEDLQATAQAFDDSELVTRELAEFDELATTADEYGRAVVAIGDCKLRRGV